MYGGTERNLTPLGAFEPDRVVRPPGLSEYCSGDSGTPWSHEGILSGHASKAGRLHAWVLSEGDKRDS